MYDLKISPALTFDEGFRVWLDQHIIDPAGRSGVRYISPRTERDWRQFARAAGKFFGRLHLEEIHAGHLNEYQRARAVCDPGCGAWRQGAGVNLIKKEIGLVKRILVAAGCWTADLDENHTTLPGRESDVGRALTPAEQARLMSAAASREAWRVVYWWAILALQTTASTNELRRLARGDIFLDQGVINVRSAAAKNKFRLRTIPVTTPEAAWALSSLLERSARLGATAGFHYLFPIHRGADSYDPARPMTEWGLRKPWEAVRSAAELPWLRMYDMRHTAITRMAEAGMPIQVIMSFAGHISARMQQHYTTISMQAKRRWAAAAWSGAEMPWAGMGGGVPFALPAPAAPALPEWQRQAMAAGWMPAAPLVRRAS